MRVPGTGRHHGHEHQRCMHAHRMHKTQEHSRYHILDILYHIPDILILSRLRRVHADPSDLENPCVCMCVCVCVCVIEGKKRVACVLKRCSKA